MQKQVARGGVVINWNKKPPLYMLGAAGFLVRKPESVVNHPFAKLALVTAGDGMNNVNSRIASVALAIALMLINHYPNSFQEK